MSGEYWREREIVAKVLESWTQAPQLDSGEKAIYGPNTGEDLPEPKNDRANPRCYVSWELEYDSSELADMTLDGKLEGKVSIGLWQERRSGDRRIREMAEQLRALFLEGDTEGMYFLEPLPGEPLVNSEDNPTFYGRVFYFPFTLFREPSPE